MLLKGNSLWKSKLWKGYFLLSLLVVYSNILQKIPNTSGWFVFDSKEVNEQDCMRGTTRRCRGDYSALPLVPP